MLAAPLHHYHPKTLVFDIKAFAIVMVILDIIVQNYQIFLPALAFRTTGAHTLIFDVFLFVIFPNVYFSICKQRATPLLNSMRMIHAA